MSHVSEMDAMIRHLALSGEQDYDCRGLSFYDIYWKVIDHYLLVYIEDIVEYHYRLFDCGQIDAFYDQKLVLDPSYEDENYKCLYDHKESQYSASSLYIAEGKWYDDFKQHVNNYCT